MASCINCQTETTTTHCPNCGQRMGVKRVTFKGIIQDFLSKWIGFDNQFGRTVLDMAINPGRVTDSYLKGNRTKYIGPLGFLVVMTALLIISFDVLGLEVQDFIKTTQKEVQPFFQNDDISPKQLEAQQKVQTAVNEFTAKYFRFFSVVIIPFWAIVLGLFYRKEKLNYMETLVVTVYLSCEALWMNIIVLVIFKFTGSLYSIHALAISTIYYSYGLKKIFPNHNVIVSVFKTLSSLIGGFLLFMLFMLLVVFAFGITKVIQNPELIQQTG